MKPTLITLPPLCAQRISHEIATQIVGFGETTLLAEPLLGFVASRECPGHVLLDTLDRVPEWILDGRVVISGFHSPLEQQVLRSLLRRKGRVVKVLARGMVNYRPKKEERESLSNGNMLVLTAYPSTVPRTTRATALARNDLVVALATEHYIPYIAQDSPLKMRLAEVKYAR